MGKGKPIRKRKVLGRKPAKLATANQRISFQKYIDTLETQKAALEKECIHALSRRLADARKIVASLEDKLVQLTGKPARKTNIQFIRGLSTHG